MKSIKGIKRLIGAASAMVAFGFAAQASAGTSPFAGDLIVNEYNAVGPDKVLDDCDLPSPADPIFGCDEGNGGDWIELYVVNDIASIKGWKISWDNEDPDVGTVTFVDSGNVGVWDDLLAGTIITVRKSDGGADNCAGGHGTANCYNPCGGDWWIRVDSNGTFTDETTHSFESDNDCQRYKLLDNNGDVVQDWVGEGHDGEIGSSADCVNATTYWDGSNLSAREVGKLEADPAQGHPLLSGNAACDDGFDYFYNDGDCSTFGAANGWNDCFDGQDCIADLRAATCE